MGEDAAWFAIRTQKDFQVARILKDVVDDVFFPTEQVRSDTGHTRVRAIIPHVLFIRTTPSMALEIESRGRRIDDAMPPLWVYRYRRGDNIQRISDSEIALLRLLTATDSTRCEIYRKTDFEPGQMVRVASGPFAGYTGSVQRVKRNRHVVVRIEGICAVLLPFIHPDLLQPLPTLFKD